MTIMINDPAMANELLEARRASGADRYDEVWEGVYMMAPMADNEHQRIATELAIAFGAVIDWQDLGRTLAGANVSDRRTGWVENFRVPDVLVLLNNTTAEDCGTHWFGGPDFAVEIVSPGDRTLEKLDFYSSIKTHELLVIGRDPWQLTLYRARHGEKLAPVAVSSLTQDATIQSSVIPICIGMNAPSASIRLTRETGQLIRDIPVKVERGG